jgi:aspartate aminotransferase
MPAPGISKRGLTTPPSPIRKLAPYADDAKARNIKVYHLNIGQPDIPTPPEFFEAIHDYSLRVLAYNPSNGISDLLDGLTDYYHHCGFQDIVPENILVATGGSEAVIFSMMAVTSPGDEIIILEPFYPNYNGFAHMSGVKLVPVETSPKNGYHCPPTEKIVEKITPRTKAILICSPCNPTGAVMTREEMERIAGIALQNNLFVLSDEVYREFTFEGTHTSVLDIPSIEKHAIMMDSLSKRYSACGARIGCVVSRNEEVMQTVLKFGQARLCPPTLEQIGANAVIRTMDKYFSKMLEEYRSRRDTIYQQLTAVEGIVCEKPAGAFYLMVTFPVADIEDFARWLLCEYDLNGETTMIAPGPGFYATQGRGKQEARIAYVLNQEELIKAVNVLREGLNVYLNR